MNRLSSTTCWWCFGVALSILGSMIGYTEASLLIGSLDVGSSAAAVASPLINELLSKIVSRYDVLAVQSIADAQTAKELLNSVNRRAINTNGNGTASIYSVALGGRGAEEQLVFFYRRSSVSIVGTWNYPNRNGTFDTTPFAVHVQPVRSDSVGVRDFLCISAHTSSDPVKNLAMIQELPLVIQQAKFHFSQQGSPVPDVLLMGNLNADCMSFPSENWQKILLWTDRGSGYKWLLTRSADTTTTRSTSCALDRFVASGQAMIQSIVASSAAVFRFDLAYALTTDEALMVSEHYPIEVRVQAADTVSQTPTMSGNPALVIHTAPIGVTNSRTAKIWFDLSPMPPDFNPKKDTLSFMCRYDDAPMATSCSSPWTAIMMEEGPHTLVIIPVTLQGRNYSAASYTWSVDTRPPVMTSILAAVDKTDRAVLAFTCDEANCMYECYSHDVRDNPTTSFVPCWGGYQSTQPISQSGARMNISVRAVDRAGNTGIPVLYSIDKGDATAGDSSKNSTASFLTKNLIFVACGCTALGVSMVWIVILLMCRTSSSSNDDKSSDRETSPYRGRGKAVADGGAGSGGGGGGDADNSHHTTTPVALSPVIVTPPPVLSAHSPNLESGTGQVGGADGGHASAANGAAGAGGRVRGSSAVSHVTMSMQECNSTSSMRPAMYAAGGTGYMHIKRTQALEQTTHFNAMEVHESVNRESGDGQSHKEEKAAFEFDHHSRLSMFSHGVLYDNKNREQCPSRSHRSSRCVCGDKDEQIRQHNERKRERRRRRQNKRCRNDHHYGASSGAVTDVEHYTYQPLVLKSNPQQTYSPSPHQHQHHAANRSLRTHSNLPEQPEDALSKKSRTSAEAAAAAMARAAAALNNGDMATATTMTDGAEDSSNSKPDVKPKILDAMQRRKLAKRMMQERRAWAHYFSEINPSDGESVCSSMRSAPVLPSGLRLLTMSVDAKKDPDTQSVVSGVTTCV
ncbi:uncharacterized protein LOC135821658 [Sycon ciliatum]|uniref:uncharacterized protein LOC135821658 n=1 Tax=Sycon ciliatum TaxID=27933 RepID=UPI0031F6D0A2